MEGRVQESKKASYPIGEAKEDWKIFNMILERLEKKDQSFKFDNLREESLSYIENFNKINELPEFKTSQNKKKLADFVSEEIIIKHLDYYYSNSISRSSKTMSECRQIRQKIKKNGTNN